MTVKTRYMQLDGWYPHVKDICLENIEKLLKTRKYPDYEKNDNYFAGIVPHAGWMFSGELALHTISLLRKDNIDTVVLFGGHLPKDSPIIIYDEDYLETPIGNIKNENTIWRELIIKLNDSSIQFIPEFRQDNTIEIQLPFIKYFYPDAKIITARLPQSDISYKIGNKLGEMLKERDSQSVFIASTDLTHYGSRYGFNPVGNNINECLDWVKNINDRAFINKILEKNPKELLNHASKHKSACSAGAVAGIIGCLDGYFNKEKFIEVKELNYHTSHDIMPDSSFVSYIGMLFQIR